MRVVPFTKNRELVYGLLTRSKKFHAPITIVLKMDVTELLATLERERDEGRRIGLLAYLVKATSQLLEQHPRLNHHLFHGLLRKYEVDFGEVSCNLVLLRRAPGGDRVLLPVVMRDSNRRTLEEINQEIRRYRSTPLAEFREVQAIQRAKELPLVAMKYFSFKCRSDAAFYRRYFGTYGMSSVLHDAGTGKVQLNQARGTLTQVYANTAAAFLPTSVSEEPRVVAGEVQVRRVLTMTTMIDHHLIDGHEALFALEQLVTMVEQGQLLRPHNARAMKTLAVGPADARRGALLVHGNDLCGEFYRPLADALATRGVRTVLVTLPGFAGEPPLAPGPPRWDDLAAAIAAQLDASFPHGATLVGHSLGGLFAFLAAARAPRALRRLILCEPPIFPTRALAVAAARKYRREVVFADRDAFHNWSGATWRIHRPATFPPAALALYRDARRKADPAWIGGLFDALPALYPLPYAAVPVPTLIARGAHSGWRMRANLALLRRRFPRATAVTIPGCAHFMANEADAALADAIATFMR